MSPLEELQTYHSRGENSMNMQMGGHVSTRKSMSDEGKAVCVKCGAENARVRRARLTSK